MLLAAFGFDGDVAHTVLEWLRDRKRNNPSEVCFSSPLLVLLPRILFCLLLFRLSLLLFLLVPFFSSFCSLSLSLSLFTFFFFLCSASSLPLRLFLSTFCSCCVLCFFFLLVLFFFLFEFVLFCFVLLARSHFCASLHFLCGSHVIFSRSCPCFRTGSIPCWESASTTKRGAPWRNCGACPAGSAC